MSRTIQITLSAGLLVAATAAWLWMMPSSKRNSGDTMALTTDIHQPLTKRSDRGPSRTVVPTTILGISKPSAHLAERIDAVRGLPDDLSTSEITALIDLLRQPAPPNTSEKEWYVILNEIMEVLRQPRFQWAGYGDVMKEIMKDRNMDPVVRDYSAQYLSQWLGDSRMSHLTGYAWAPALETYLEVIGGEREALEPVTGTSLMAMSDLYEKAGSERFSGIRKRLDPLITDLVSGKRQTTLPNRISAIQAAGRMKVASALPEARRMAGDPDENSSLRLSSVAILGYFRDPADRPFLEQLSAGNEKLRFAAKEALRRHME